MTIAHIADQGAPHLAEQGRVWLFPTDALLYPKALGTRISRLLGPKTIS